MNNRLYKYREFACAYIDDVVVYSDTAEEHLEHLDKVLKLFQDINLAVALNTKGGRP